MVVTLQRMSASADGESLMGLMMGIHSLANGPVWVLGFGALVRITRNFLLPWIIERHPLVKVLNWGVMGGSWILEP